MKRLIEGFVSQNVPLPKGKDWQAFLKVSEIKDELFKFLSDELVNATSVSKYHLPSNKGEIVLSNKVNVISNITPSDHEEADSHMLLHLHHADADGHMKAFLHAVNSDIVVLSVYFFMLQCILEVEKLIGIPVHEVFAAWT